MTRLEKIASYITNEEKVLDIGCDQALLSKLLAKRHIYSIASDIKENIIENAFKSTNGKLKPYIDFRVGDGITLREEEKDYTLVMSGMGTHTMLEILSKDKRIFNKIITISNNNHDILRIEMQKLGYKVLLEEIVKEKNKLYNLIIFEKGFKKYTLEEIIVGVNHQNKELLKEKNEYLISKYSKILEKTNNKKLEKIINILKNYTY